MIDELEKKKDDCLFLIKVAEQAENFDDVCFYIAELIKYKLELGDNDFSFEEQNIIGVGLRNYVGVLQGSIRVIYALSKTKKYRKYGDHLPKFKIQL